MRLFEYKDLFPVSIQLDDDFLKDIRVASTPHSMLTCVCRAITVDKIWEFKMIQCENCEFFHRNADGEIAFSCDPFSTVKEPECVAKWQLIKINQLVGSYQATLRYYEKFAPMQEKMFNMMEREIDDMSEAESWKISDEEIDEEENHDDDNEDWRKSL